MQHPKIRKKKIVTATSFKDIEQQAQLGDFNLRIRGSNSGSQRGPKKHASASRPPKGLIPAITQAQCKVVPSGAVASHLSQGRGRGELRCRVRPDLGA